MVVKTNNKEIMNTEWHFGTPVYRIEKPEWVTKLNKATAKYIKNAQKKLKEKNFNFIVLNSLENKDTCFESFKNKITIIIYFYQKRTRKK